MILNVILYFDACLCIYVNMGYVHVLHAHVCARALRGQRDISHSVLSTTALEGEKVSIIEPEAKLRGCKSPPIFLSLLPLPSSGFFHSETGLYLALYVNAGI